MKVATVSTILAALMMMTTAAVAQDGLTLYAAGSLTESLSEAAKLFAAQTGIPVATQFGPSGLMREKIEKGDRVDVFASADMGHPLKLEKDGKARRAVMFTRNSLCALATPEARLTSDNFLDRLLSPDVKIGTSTPGSDPSGDYTWEMFRLAEKERPGAFQILDRKAQKIVGNTVAATGQSAPDPIVAAFRSGAINVQISYCTGAPQRRRDLPDLQVVEVPAAIRTGPEYGIVVLKDARAGAVDLALFILSPEGQAVLAKYGFSPVGLPAPRS